MSRILLFLFVAHVLCLYSTIINADFNRLEFCQHVSLYGLTCETYFVVTEDGYILGIQRIGNGQPEKINSTPVLIWHGALCSADSLVIMGNESTPMQLALAGYDVWMGNSRGNKYSRNHIILNPDINQQKFWDFSFHEMAIYDVPVTVDYILNETGQKKLTAIGHSQGTTINFILGSLKPEYNKKIQLIAMAPVAYLDEFPIINSLVKIVSAPELFAANSLENHLFQTTCALDMLKPTCISLLADVGGPYEEGELTDDILYEILTYYLGGGSLKTCKHFQQLIQNERFSFYDYGAIGNLAKYKRADPPGYELEKITMPVALLVGVSDMIATVDQISILKGRLPNMVYYKEIDTPKYNHLGFIASKSLPTVLNPLILDLLANFPTNELTP